MTQTLLAYDLSDGYASTLDICEPCWFYAGIRTHLDTGESHRFTYLSTGVRPGDPLYQRMLVYLDGALPIGEPQTITDPDMIFGSAELRHYELRPLDVTA